MITTVHTHVQMVGWLAAAASFHWSQKSNHAKQQRVTDLYSSKLLELFFLRLVLWWKQTETNFFWLVLPVLPLTS